MISNKVINYYSIIIYHIQIILNIFNHNLIIPMVFTPIIYICIYNAGLIMMACAYFIFSFLGSDIENVRLVL